MLLNNFTKIVASCAISIITISTYAAPSQDLTSKMQKMGKVKEVKPFSGGLTSWILEAPNGKNAVLFTTSDEKVILHGTAWDSATKKNISEPLKLTAKKMNAPAQQPTASVGNLASAYNHPVFKAVKTLSGFKEGKANDNNTVYIIYDPRCKYCHETFNLSRSYVKSGATIKWIPALVLNQSENGKQLAAGILRKPSEDTINKTFNGTDEEINSIKVIPTPQELAELDKHLGALQSIFFYHEDIVAMPKEDREQREAIRSAGQKPQPLTAGVPVAIFVNKKTGKVEARRGTSETATLDYIFK